MEDLYNNLSMVVTPAIKVTQVTYHLAASTPKTKPLVGTPSTKLEQALDISHPPLTLLTLREKSLPLR
jgi:hypothetical protein